jgi:hypothetical protein
MCYLIAHVHVASCELYLETSLLKEREREREGERERETLIKTNLHMMKVYSFFINRIEAKRSSQIKVKLFVCGEIHVGYFKINLHKIAGGHLRQHRF